MRDIYLALDIGGTNIGIGLGDRDGFIEGKYREVRTEDYWYEEGLKELVEETVDDFDVSLADLDGIGVGVPGLVNIEDRKMIYSYSLDEMDFQNLKELDVDFRVENDANLAVLGEKFYGDGRDTDNLATVIIGSGVGGGIYYGGRLLGSDEGGRSPEPAGIIVEDGTKWERAVGGKSMPGYIGKLLESEQRETELSGDLSTEEILELSEKDKVGREYVERLSELNARGIATLINTYAPELITFSGSVAVHNPEFMESSFNKVEEHAINPVPDMKVSKLGDKLSLYGALALAQDNQEENR